MASFEPASGLAAPQLCLQPHLTRSTNRVVSPRASPVCARLCARLAGSDSGRGTRLPAEKTGIHSEHAAEFLRTSAG